MTRINEVLYFVLYDLCKIKKTTYIRLLLMVEQRRRR